MNQILRLFIQLRLEEKWDIENMYSLWWFIKFNMHSIPGNFIQYYGILLKLFYSWTRVNIIYPYHDSSLLKNIFFFSFLIFLFNCVPISLPACIIIFRPGLCPPHHVAVFLNFSFFIMTPHSFDGLLFNPSYHYIFLSFTTVFLSLCFHIFFGAFEQTAIQHCPLFREYLEGCKAVFLVCC